MSKTNIGWTHWPGYIGASWNPIAAYHQQTGKRGWYCEKVPGRPECAFCYASDLNQRLGNGLEFAARHRKQVDIQLAGLDIPLKTKAPTCWFVNSMTDLFADFVTDDMIHVIIHQMVVTPRHQYLILTKREQRMCEFLMEHYSSMTEIAHIGWGTSAGTQKALDAAVPWLLKTPASMRFISIEPLLENVRLDPHWMGAGGRSRENYEQPQIHWVLVGGESGKSRRDCGVEAIEDVARQCKETGVACYIKQDSAFKPGQQGRISDAVWAIKEIPH